MAGDIHGEANDAGINAWTGWSVRVCHRCTCKLITNLPMLCIHKQKKMLSWAYHAARPAAVYDTGAPRAHCLNPPWILPVPFTEAKPRNKLRENCIIVFPSRVSSTAALCTRVRVAEILTRKTLKSKSRQWSRLGEMARFFRCAHARSIVEVALLKLYLLYFLNIENCPQLCGY